MGSQFLEKHKRKSVLAALLLLFSGNSKYVIILLLLAATSVPFVVSRDSLSRLLETPAIASMMRHLGLGSVLSSINPKYSSDMLKSAMDRALADSEQNSYWNRFLRTLNGGGAGGAGGAGGRGGAGGGSGLDMITGGEILTADASGKGKKGKGKGGSGEDGEGGADGEGGYGAGGANGDTVYLDGQYGSGAGGYGAGGRGGKGGKDGKGGADGLGAGGFGAGGFGANGFGGGANGSSGLYGDLMGANLADRYGSGAGGDGAGGAGGSGSYGGGYGSGGSLTAPYIGKNSTGNGGSAAGKGDGRLDSALGATSGKIPVPGSPSKVNAKSLGRVSGFTWKNVGYTVAGAKMNVRLGQEASIYRLADTFAMTTSAAQFTTAAPEYQASYTGATYDGNPVNLDLVQTLQDPPVVSPDVSYIDQQTIDVTGVQAAAEVCTNSQSTHGTLMSDAMTDMTVREEEMSHRRPDCDNSGAVNAWNSEVTGYLLPLCQKFNAENALLSADCQVNPDPIGCGMYSTYTDAGGMLIKYCPKPGCKCSWKNPFCCFIWFLFWLLFFAVMAALWAIFGPLMAILAAVFTVLLLDTFFPDDATVPAGLDPGPGGMTENDMKTKFTGTPAP